MMKVSKKMSVGAGEELYNRFQFLEKKRLEKIEKMKKQVNIC